MMHAIILPLNSDPQEFAQFSFLLFFQVKTLSREQNEILDLLARMLEISASEAMRTAFMEYAKSISLITEKVHGKI